MGFLDLLSCSTHKDCLDYKHTWKQMIGEDKGVAYNYCSIFAVKYCSVYNIIYMVYWCDFLTS